MLWLASFALLASEIIWFFTLWTSSSESIPTVDPYYDDFTPEDSYDSYDYGVLAAAFAGGKKALNGRSAISGRGYEDEVVATLVAPICVIAAAALGGIEL